MKKGVSPKDKSKMGRPLSEEMLMSIERKAKRCKNCFKIKDHSEFHVQKQMPDGRHMYCKVCRNKYQYQLQLKQRQKLEKNIIECADCGDLFSKTSDYKLCRRCR